MAYTTPTPYWETSSPPGSSHIGAKEFAVWLNGTHAVHTNAAPWAIIDCYDGVTREQPAGGDSNNLSALNRWREDQGVPGENAWIVWQAPGGGDVVNRFQFYMEMTTFTAVFFGIFMLNDWAVGAGADSNPDIPATSIGVPPFAGGMDSTFANHTDYTWRAVADEGTIIIGCYPTAAGFPEFIYAGDLKNDQPEATNGRCFVISKTPDASGWNGQYLNVSIVDDSTIITCNDEIAQAGGFEDAQDQDAGWTRRALCEVACYSNAASNFFRMGKFRLCAGISRHARTASVERVTCGVGVTDFDYEVSGRGGDSAALMVTRYGVGTVLDRHIELVERSIPLLLETS